MTVQMVISFDFFGILSDVAAVSLKRTMAEEPSSCGMKIGNQMVAGFLLHFLRNLARLGGYAA